jgi:hypothetical protein
VTTQAQAREAIYLRFTTQWGTRTTSTFENETFDDTKQEVSWVRLSVRHTGGGQDTLGKKGSRKYRRAGLIQVQIFTPKDAGLDEADGHVAVLKTIFEGESFSGVDCNDLFPRERGEDGKWYLTVVECDFDYDEIR